MKIATIILFLSVAFPSEVYLQILRDTSIAAFKLDRKFNDHEKAMMAIDTLVSLMSHHDSLVRSIAQSKITRIGLLNNDLSVQKKCVKSLLRFSRDPYIPIRDNNSGVYKSFPKSAYDQEFVLDLKDILHLDSFVNRGHILLVGFLDMEDEKSFLDRRFLRSRERSVNDFSLHELNRFDFTARMALARLGEKEHIDYVVKRILDEPEQTILLKWLKYLDYIKNPKAMEIMIDYLFMDKMVLNPSGYETPYSFLVLPYLSKSIQDFPFSKNGLFGYSDEEVREARKWMSLNRSNYLINRDVW